MLGNMRSAKDTPLNANRSDPRSPEEDLCYLRRLLLIACVFSAVGGYTDAYSYLVHGRVFANAQTGNIIFFAIFASEGQWIAAVGHLPPIMAFALGVAVANLFGVETNKRFFRATLICQLFELVILITLTVVGSHLPDACIVPIISFVAAIQNTSLNKVGSWSFNSAMTTGNLRTAIAGLTLWIIGRDSAENRDKAFALGSICLSFLVGALGGAVYSRIDGPHALGPCAALVAIGIFLTWRERIRRAHQYLPIR